jgi:hypothetical protein
LENSLGLKPEELNDAVDELEEQGMVKVLKEMGTGPYDFSQIEPTYVLYREFREHLPYNADADAKEVAAALVALGEAEAAYLAERTKLSPGRLNRAVAYLEDYGLADVQKWLGTAPYDFGLATATRRTRQFVS